MNIALFTDCYLPIKNGVVTSVLQLKEGLEKKGHFVIVITPEVPNYEENDPNIFRLPSVKLGLGSEQRFALFYQGAINRFIKKKEIDLIHTHTEFSIGQSGKIAAKKLKIPHVHTTHTMWEEYTHYIMNGKILTPQLARKILKFLLKNTYAIISPSIKSKKYNQTIMPDVPVKIINNGIDVNRFKNSVITEDDKIQLRREFKIKKQDKIIIFVGRIGMEKKVKELFQITSQYLKNHKNTKMIFVGDGPQLKELRNRTIQNNQENDFIFTGFVNWEMVYRLYSISDIFVTTSTSEVHPMTLIEASMCGLPLIARRDDSYQDLIIDDYNGFLVDQDEEVLEKLEYILEDQDTLIRFSENSLINSQKFTAEVHVNKMEKFYQRVLEKYPE
ncbi:MAG: glycosyltransferase, partial [Spirochaetes bacterium]|nr:glycosyltransferase [Spirochaetota bacterium]